MALRARTANPLKVGTAPTDVYDLRSEFWRTHFDLAKEYELYLAESDQDQARYWREMAEHLPPVTDAQKARLQGYGRTLNVLMYSGVWCGDCIRTGPMLRLIVEACEPGVELRLIDREVSKALQEELRILGGRRVPTVVFLSENFYEVGRFGDRLLSYYRIQAQLRIGLSCETGLVPPPGEHLAAELADWVDLFERMLLMVRLSPTLRVRHDD